MVFSPVKHNYGCLVHSCTRTVEHLPPSASQGGRVWGIKEKLTVETQTSHPGALTFMESYSRSAKYRGLFWIHCTVERRKGVSYSPLLHLWGLRPWSQGTNKMASHYRNGLQNNKGGGKTRDPLKHSALLRLWIRGLEGCRSPSGYVSFPRGALSLIILFLLGNSWFYQFKPFLSFVS